MILVLFGPSGCGKSTVGDLLLKDDKFSKLITDTTRLPRKGEIDKKDYNFRTKEEFLSDIKSGKYLEYAEYSENYYGSRIESFNNMLEQKKHIVIIMDINGVKRIKKEFPKDTISIFVSCSLDKLEERMKLRGDSKEKIQERIQNIHKTNEMDNIIYADYIIQNNSSIEVLKEQIEELKKSVV